MGAYNISGCIGVDVGVRRLLTCCLVADNLAPAKTWCYDAGPAMQVLTRGMSGDEAIGVREIRVAKDTLFMQYHAAAKEIVHVAETYHCKIAMESPPKPGSFPSPWVQVGAMFVRDDPKGTPSVPGAVLALLPLQALFDDLVFLCRRAGLEEPLSVDAPGTSHTCARCLKEDWKGRNGDEFHCQWCHYVTDADNNAAHIIGIRGWSTHLSHGGQGPAVVINHRLADPGALDPLGLPAP